MQTSPVLFQASWLQTKGKMASLSHSIPLLVLHGRFPSLSSRNRRPSDDALLHRYRFRCGSGDGCREA